MSTAKIRCAIYTRKSTDEGLDQDFNSLDAQYEACAAYITSRWCQTNANQSLFAARCQKLCRTKLAPLGESGTSVDLEIGA